MARNGEGRGAKAQLGVHFCGWTLDGLAADNGGNRQNDFGGKGGP